MFSRQTPLLCPHCQKELPFSTYKKYFYHSYDYVTTCPHCGGRMQQENSTLWVAFKFHFPRALSQAFLFFAAFNFYIHKFGDNFWPAVLFSVALTFPAMLYHLWDGYCRLKLVKAE